MSVALHDRLEVALAQGRFEKLRKQKLSGASPAGPCALMNCSDTVFAKKSIYGYPWPGLG